MDGFRFDTQTCLYYGRNAVKEHQEVFDDFGKKAIIVTSKFAEGCPNLGLEDVKEIFDAKGIAYMVIDFTIPNPPVENIEEMYEKTKDFQADFIVGIGGGSSLDAAKALAQLTDGKRKDPEKSAIDIFFGHGKPYDNYRNMCDIPVLTLPTTAGTGSEVTGGAVLTRNDIHTKIAMNQWLYPVVSFVDPRYIEDSPLFLLDTGVIDALAHGVESFIRRKDHLYAAANIMNQGISKIAFQLFAEFKDNLLNDTLTAEDYDKIALASMIQGIAFMQSCTCIPHGMGYPLSHYYDICHGLSCGVFLGEWLKNFKDQSLIQEVITDCGFKTSDEFADYVRALTNRDVELEVTDEEIQKWSDQFMAQQTWRIESNPEELTRDDIYTIYRRALAKYIKE
ncbi:MAG: iron-containing alcohol dehydrogenase [Oscillospiraceae bacterium]|nr:iron-containing alcohol dehydrogenase [Oscillospiraceae bacterium]